MEECSTKTGIRMRFGNKSIRGSLRAHVVVVGLALTTIQSLALSFNPRSNSFLYETYNRYPWKNHQPYRKCEKWSMSGPCVIAPVLMRHLTMAFCSLFLRVLMKRLCHYCLSSEFGDPFKHDCLTRAWLPATPSERACPCSRWTNIQPTNGFWSRPLQCLSRGSLSGPRLIRTVWAPDILEDISAH